MLRNHVEWAIHCCAVLAGLEAGEYLSTKALAEFHGVPKEYLSKALQNLARAGLVEGTLGPTGGYRLARPPKAISFLDIVEAVDGKSQGFQCTNIRANNPCLKAADKKFSKPCAVARVMHRADAAWKKELAETTLADLVTDVQADVPAAVLQKSQDWLKAQ